MLMTPPIETFITLCFILAITPGADTALVLKSSLSGSTKLLCATIAGICAGLFFHATLSSLGLSVILANSKTLYSIVKYIGAVYLIYLGVRGLFDAYKGDHLFEEKQKKNLSHSIFLEFKKGLLTNILNPKVAVFYLTFLPQFTDSGKSIFLQSIALSTIHILMSIIWLFLVGYFITFFKHYLEKKFVRSFVEAISGSTLLLFGIKLLFQRS